MTLQEVFIFYGFLGKILLYFSSVSIAKKLDQVFRYLKVTLLWPAFFI